MRKPRTNLLRDGTHRSPVKHPPQAPRMEVAQSRAHAKVIRRRHSLSFDCRLQASCDKCSHERPPREARQAPRQAPRMGAARMAPTRHPGKTPTETAPEATPAPLCTALTLGEGPRHNAQEARGVIPRCTNLSATRHLRPQEQAMRPRERHTLVCARSTRLELPCATRLHSKRDEG